MPNAIDRPRTFLGHPRGLLTLALAESFERFSYYGMQSLLVLYLIHSLLQPGHVEHVLGFATLRHGIEAVTGPLSDAALASQIFGLYAGMVYLTPLFGGLLADRVLGRTTAVASGALLMVAGHFLMAFDASFVLAMGLLLCGEGLFKGNIASQVGELYARGDTRLAGAFLIFQNAINTSVILSPLLCGTLGEKAGWHWGFGAAGVVMVLALGVYLYGRPHLPKPVPRARLEAAVHAPVSAREWRAMALLVLLLPVLAASQVGNQQMFNAYVVWGEQRLALTWLGWSMPVTWLLSLDAFLALAMTLAVLLFWRWWATRRREPDEIVKIAIGTAIMALAPLLLAAASALTPVGTRISLSWALAFHVVNEIGFAMVIPVGLALYSRAAPPRFIGLMIGLFYLLFFFSNLVVGRLGGLLGTMTPAAFWTMHAGIVGAAAVVLAAAAQFGRGVLAPGPALRLDMAQAVPAG
ncbi:MAG TPA: peptide MFS transporter [Rhodanobacteraceae bacterium]|nr:peptide MFS transporter [Rhodanobacteraceae bacterium]